MRRLLPMVSVLALMAGPVWASDKLEIAPPPAWVKPLPVPEAPDASGSGAVQMLLLDSQSHIAADGEQITYADVASKLLTPEALAGGNIALQWNPDLQSLTVNRLHIIRGKQVIDVLAHQQFTVIRRESNLERAALDGALTATLQPEGLQVGDIVELAMTMHTRDPALAGHAQTLFPAFESTSIERLHLRIEWAAPRQMHWREAGWLTPIKPTMDAGGGGKLELDVAKAQPYQPPAGAPQRYRAVSLLETTDFGSWNDVSRLMAPLYAKASMLAPGSPLEAEAARIAAASKDPRVRAGKALQLVESQVRYLYLGMNDGGYTPAAADLTWTRRFGDCKGKTTLLLALLHQLGIEAEPALVSTSRGDGLDGRLPGLGLFDHVLVRAKIAGRVYWLDGARTGDEDIGRLTVPNYFWALPVNATGEGLEKLSPPPLEAPTNVRSIRIDASAGLDTPAPVHMEQLFSGDDGAALKVTLFNLPKAEFDKYARSYWTDQYDWLTAKTWSAAPDPATGGVKMTVDGTAKMDWELINNEGRRYQSDIPTPGWKADFHRDPGQQQADAPYAVEYPAYTRTVETIVLPAGGKGFSYYGKDLDDTVAARRFTRHVSLDKGVFTAEVTSHSLAPEFPMTDAAAAQARLRELDRQYVYVYAPVSYAPTTGDLANPSKAAPTEGSAYTLGRDLMKQGKTNEAIAQFDKALQLDPRSVPTLLARGWARLDDKDVPGAFADFDAAAAIEPNSALVQFTIGTAHARLHQDELAMQSLDKAVAASPGDGATLLARAQLRVRLGKADLARADFEAAELAVPGNRQVFEAAFNGYQDLHDYAECLRLAQAWTKAHPDDVDGLNYRAVALALLKRRNEARDQYSRSIALKPTAWAYAGRAELWPESELAQAKADVDQALKLEPDSEPARLVKIKLATKSGDITAILAGEDAEVAAHPKAPGPLNSRCWIRATHNVDLEAALRDCDAAVKLAPRSSAIRDSRGFVELRLGRIDAAIADYDEALALKPDLVQSLYGRALAKLRRGDTAGGEADLAAARKASDKVEKEFAGYGVTS